MESGLITTSDLIKSHRDNISNFRKVIIRAMRVIVEKEVDDFLNSMGYKMENDDSDLFIENQMDSLNYIQLLIEMESFFEITIPDRFLNMDNFITKKRIISTLEAIVSEQ